MTSILKSRAEADQMEDSPTDKDLRANNKRKLEDF